MLTVILNLGVNLTCLLELEKIPLHVYHPLLYGFILPQPPPSPLGFKT